MSHRNTSSKFCIVILPSNSSATRPRAPARPTVPKDNERVKRRLTSILVADVAGYSRLVGADEEGTLARWKAHWNSLLNPKIKQHFGRLVRTRGDRAAAVSSGTDAAAAAAPKPAAVVEPAAVADDNALDSAALLAVIRDMADDLPGMMAEPEAQARSSAQGPDHSQHSFYSRLASVLSEFRNGLGTALNAPQV